MDGGWISIDSVPISKRTLLFSWLGVLSTIWLATEMIRKKRNGIRLGTRTRRAAPGGNGRHRNQARGEKKNITLKKMCRHKSLINVSIVGRNNEMLVNNRTVFFSPTETNRSNNNYLFLKKNSHYLIHSKKIGNQWDKRKLWKRVRPGWHAPGVCRLSTGGDHTVRTIKLK